MPPRVKKKKLSGVAKDMAADGKYPLLSPGRTKLSPHMARQQMQHIHFQKRRFLLLQGAGLPPRRCESGRLQQHVTGESHLLAPSAHAHP